MKYETCTSTQADRPWCYTEVHDEEDGAQDGEGVRLKWGYCNKYCSSMSL